MSEAQTLYCLTKRRSTYSIFFANQFNFLSFTWLFCQIIFRFFFFSFFFLTVFQHFQNRKKIDRIKAYLEFILEILDFRFFEWIRMISEHLLNFYKNSVIWDFIIQIICNFIEVYLPDYRFFVSKNLKINISEKSKNLKSRNTNTMK